jgi:hypothetical protein
MKTRMTRIIIALIMAIAILSACATLSPSQTKAIQPGAVQTYAIHTLAAEATLRQQSSSPTPLPTYSPIPPTNTLISIPTNTLLPAVPTELFSPQEAITTTATATIIPTPDYSRTLEDGTPAPCNAAKFITDVTIPDEMRVAMGEKFTKIWRVKNIGACAWTSEYALVLIYGNLMNAKPPIYLDRVVAPDEEMDLIINMQAPYIPACWVSNWMLQDPNGERFGVGYKFQSALNIVISVYIPGFNIVRDPCKNE